MTPLTPRTLASRFARAVQLVPVVFMLLLAAAVLLGEASELTGLRPLAGAWGSRAFLILLVLVTAGLSRQLKIWETVAPPMRFALAPAIPGLVLAGYAIAVRPLPAGKRAEWFLGADHVRHLMFVPELQGAGNLSYAQQSYPRAWQTLVTAVWSATGGRPDADGFRSLVDLMSTAAWFLPAVLSVATGSLAVHVGRRVGLGERGRGEAPIAVAGLGAAAMVLWPSFLSIYQALGFENSFVGGIVLAVVAVEVIARKDGGGLAAVGVVLAAAVVCAHCWQLLLPAVGVAFIVLAGPLLARGDLRTRAVLLWGVLAAGLVATPALVAVFTVIGIQHATDAGVKAPRPAAMLLVALLCSTWLAVRHREDRRMVGLWLVVLFPCLTGLALAARVGIPVTQYYPSKLLWHSATLGLAPLAVVAVSAWRRLTPAALENDTGPVVPLAGVLRVVTGVGGLLVLGVALIAPAGAFVGAWSTVRGPVVLDAVTSPGADGAQVVWLGTKGDDTIGRILLDFYRAGHTAARTPQPPLDVSQECALLKAASTPTVLSDRAPDEVRRRYSCVPAVRVIPVPR
ncbi:hypothetical protein BJ986_002177 [Phycicoccus badiiscoriae]|uniref:Uncharacterized protein n=1 Tax=Pedococcus badiiscoriae TaxID=642776 RepID=A0A852WFY0_9MICO|nr:hypothetical protein [Pedococcus badiiscoriae]NYG07690.1 hypothetical protein [Pedococcus badiiscoriae]